MPRPAAHRSISSNISRWTRERLSLKYGWWNASRMRSTTRSGLVSWLYHAYNSRQQEVVKGGREREYVDDETNGVPDDDERRLARGLVQDEREVVLGGRQLTRASEGLCACLRTLDRRLCEGSEASGLSNTCGILF